jgi:hypothetical protein
LRSEKTFKRLLEDPEGLPDWTLPVSIIAQAIEKLKVDIVAQSIGNIGVDIKAQSVTLNVNVLNSVINVNITNSTVNVTVQGTASVNITQAVANISSLRLMDSGSLVHGEGSAWGNAYTTLYTVPAGKVLYLYSAMLNVCHYAAGDHIGYMMLYDGATDYYLISLRSPDSVDQMNEMGTFTLTKVPAGWSVRIYANAYARATGVMVGVLVNA